MDYIIDLTTEQYNLLLDTVEQAYRDAPINSEAERKLYELLVQTDAMEKD